MKYVIENQKASCDAIVTYLSLNVEEGKVFLKANGYYILEFTDDGKLKLCSAVSNEETGFSVTKDSEYVKVIKGGE